MLNGSGIDAIVSELVACAVAEHVGMGGKGHSGQLGELREHGAEVTGVASVRRAR